MIKVKEIYFPESCAGENPEEGAEIYAELTNGAVVNFCGAILPYPDKYVFSTDCFMGVIDPGDFTSDDFNEENWCKIEKEIATSILIDFNGTIKDENMYYYDEVFEAKIEFTDFSLSDAGLTNTTHKVEQTKNPENDSPNTSGLNNQGEGSTSDRQKVDSQQNFKQTEFINQAKVIPQQDAELNQI